MTKRILGNAVKLIFLTIGLSANLFAQENPWSNSKSNYNPWTQGSESAKEEKSPTANSALAAGSLKTDLKPNTPQVQQVVQHQEGSFTLKHRNGTTQTYLRSEVNTDFVLQQYGKEKYRAPTGAILSGLGSFVAPGISVPFTMLSPLSTTKQTQLILFEFEKNNPEATAADIKSIKKGMRKKRYKHAVIGTIIGTIGGLIIWNT